MVDVEIKGLVARLNKFCTRGLEAAAAKCVSRTNYEVTPEHMLFVMNEDPNADLQAVYKHFGLDVGMVQKALGAAIEDFRTGNSSRPVFSPVLLDWFQNAWLISSVDYSMPEIRSGALLFTLLSHPERYAAGDYLPAFEAVKRGELKAQLLDITRGSIERYETRDSGKKISEDGRPEKGVAGESALAKFCTDFTGRAREGKLDPVFGRDPEIRQMVDILARRRKNNPICVGDPGVGKTAVVEGLALRIVEGDVPDSLRGVELMGLDLALLQAGASVKGEFENRLKNVINEVKSSAKPIILFIDEAHTLVGAGGAAGTGDAGQLLKPALARGELRTIAATTWSEYKKYFEKDAALARRFQLVKLDEPNEAVTVTMLRGLRDRYEQAHGVLIRDDALTACAQLGSRYIAGRQHPDKGIDLMDTSAARVKVALTTKPPELQDLERSIQTIERELAAYKRDQSTGQDGLEDMISQREKSIAGLKDKAASLTERWQKEKAAAEKVLDIRRKMFEATGQTLGGQKPKAEAPPSSKKETKLKVKDEPKKETKIKSKADVGALKKDLDAALADLKKLQGKDPLIQIEVTPDIVAKVISDWTGIPIGKMVQDEAASLLEFEKQMTQRVKGQDHVMKILGTGIRASKAGLKDPKTPIGVFLLVGPSGTGKTETALGVADLMFGGERMMTTINMSEFQEKHTVSRLIGSPPGYVGYGEGGVLTEGVRQKPYSVVLLDEVEKADPDVMNLFYQVFDKGMLSDGEGREVDFKDTIIFMTSNLASDMIQQAVPVDGSEKPPLDDLIATIRPVLSKHFKPALLARMSIVPFFPIDVNAMKDIVILKLNKIKQRMAENHKMLMVVDDKVIDNIAARCTEVETGARNIDHILRGTLLPKISSEILSQMTQGPLPEKLTVGMDDKGEFTFAFGKK